jgi:hypothetical protein
MEKRPHGKSRSEPSAYLREWHQYCRSFATPNQHTTQRRRYTRKNGGFWRASFVSKWRALRPMKMGTIVSLWRYDASAGQAPPLDNLRRPAILRYAS